METIKKLFWAILGYFMTIGAFCVPMLVLLLGFDFIANLEINFLDESSVLRIIFFIWFIFVNVAYIKSEFWIEIKKYL